MKFASLFAAVVLIPMLSVRAATPTVAECEAFGKEIERHVASGDTDFYARSFDLDALLDLVFLGQGDMDSRMQSIRENLKQGMSQGFIREFRQLKKLKYLRTRPAGRQMRILMRVQNKAGLNYVELIPTKDAKGHIRIADSYMYFSGENMSETKRRILIPVLADNDKSFLEKLFNDTPDLVKYEQDWAKLPKLNAEGKYSRTLTVCAQLPAALQREKFILIQRMVAAKAVDTKEYLAAMELWRRAYPNDPSLDLISIDAFTLQKNYAGALDCIDRLDKSIGGDPYLDYQRAIFYSLMKDRTKATAAAQRAFKGDPSLVEAGILALIFSSEDHQYDQCVAMLNEMQSEGGISRNRLARVVENSPRLMFFSKSDAYRNWLGATPSTSAQVTGDGGRIASGPEALKLQGIVYKATGASATINGDFVAVGDPLGDYKVIAIEPDSVTLQSFSGEKTVLKMGGSR